MYRRFLRCFFPLFLCLTIFFAGTVWAVDPWYHYHGPLAGLPLCLRDGRYQNDGAAKHLDYDILLLGTSVTANFRTDEIDRLTGGKAQKLIVQGGYFSDFYGPLDAALSTHAVKAVYWGTDSNCLRRYDSANPWQEPTYLFDNNPFNDGAYLLNKEMFFWDLTAVLERAWAGDRQDESTGGYTWGEDNTWSRESALRSYHRSETTASAPVSSDALLAPAKENVKNMLKRVDEHPNITFTFYLAPYSILFWDQTIRSGELDATLTMHRVVLEALTSRPNTRVFYLMDDTDLITDLDHYCDHIHYSPAVCQQLLETIIQETPMTPAEIGPRLEVFRNYLLRYDYDDLWT